MKNPQDMDKQMGKGAMMDAGRHKQMDQMRKDKPPGFSPAMVSVLPTKYFWRQLWT